jgi:hypothetical protein
MNLEQMLTAIKTPNGIVLAVYELIQKGVQVPRDYAEKAFVAQVEELAKKSIVQNKIISRIKDLTHSLTYDQLTDKIKQIGISSFKPTQEQIQHAITSCKQFKLKLLVGNYDSAMGLFSETRDQIEQTGQWSILQELNIIWARYEEAHKVDNLKKISDPASPAYKI